MALKIAALTGGVGGAKLVDGFAAIMAAENLAVVVNSGDDFEHLGLVICPDLDTVMYTLAGVANPQTGWGRASETWNFLKTIVELGGPGWFQIGDRDLALHVERTRRLRAGEPLSAITGQLCSTLGVSVRVLPMSDDPVRTIVVTDEGDLPFQEYFVARRCEPTVRGFRFDGVEDAAPAPGVIDVIRQADVVVMCPSNPWVSLDPILALSGLRKVLEEKIILGVSPIIGGRAIKGPAAKIYADLGYEPSAMAIAEHYRPILSAFVIDEQDRMFQSRIEAMGLRVFVTDILMKDRSDRSRLASEILKYIYEELVVGMTP
ncbi:MAG: 2-phospho-L-lactate transferase [Anaerolineales bacterium]|nr:2-phospho-L-lactate transferase [Anaerolineales bacterium]